MLRFVPQRRKDQRMAKRSKTNKVADGHKAIATMIEVWGEEELSRIAKMGQWTKEHRASNPKLNPFSRDNYYKGGKPPTHRTPHSELFRGQE
jgi:hypothetical protein